MSWGNSHPYRITKNVNADATRYGLVIHFTTPPDIKRWGAIFGDAIFNLRCALDHVTYAVATHESNSGLSDVEARRIQFPIADSASRFAEMTKSYKLTTLISDAVRTQIEGFQPYNRGHHEFPPLLAVLRNLSDSDKHRLLTPTLTQFHSGAFNRLGIHVEKGQPIKFVAHTGDLKDGTEIVSLEFDRPYPNMNCDFDAIIVINMKHRIGPKGLDKTDVIGLLETLTGEVRLVISAIQSVVS